jgi:hypothetical protein
MLMPIEPPEIPPATPGHPAEPPPEAPPGSPLPEVPPPMREPGEPPQPDELPGKIPDEMPGCGPSGPNTPSPATDAARQNIAVLQVGTLAASSSPADIGNFGPKSH